MRLNLSNVAEDAMLEAVRGLLDGGSLRLYDSVPPSSASAAISAQTHLASIRFLETKLDGGQVRGFLDQTPLAIASGDATWARAYSADGSAVLDCDVGETGSDAAIELNTIGLRTGGPIVIRSFSVGVRR